MACKDYKDLAETVAFRKVFDYEGGSWTEGEDGTFTTDTYSYHVSAACNHCETPACMTACPAAKEFDDETGFVANEKEIMLEPAREIV